MDKKIKKIYLIGFMGSGKTTIGGRLADLIGFDFVDTDHYIEMQHGITISEIFAQHGEAAFREMEQKLLLEIQYLDNVVVSTGGGMPIFGDNMDVMRSGGKVVYLKASPQTLANRLLCSQDKRPLVKEKTEEELQQYIEEKLSEREPFYACAHIVVQSDDFSMEETLLALEKFVSLGRISHT